MKTYDDVFNEAIDKANLTGMDVGITRDIFGGWSTFLLPRPENRRGKELRCQVVKPGTPRSAPVKG